MSKNQTEHVKHPKLEKPLLEGMARKQVAFVGAPCGLLEEAMKTVETALSSDLRTIVIDADHHDKVEGKEERTEERIISHRPFTEEKYFEDKLLGQYFDLALINGNHYPADHQVVFLEKSKEGSLKRRMDQLTDPILYVQVDVDGFDWLEVKEGCPTLSWNEKDQISTFISKWMEVHSVPLTALILAGGESRRMGQDKSQISYHGQTQEVHLASMCQTKGLPTYISKRDTEEDMIEGFPVLKDTFIGMGPYGAILSAFQKQRNSALLVVACDMPHIHEDTLDLLIQERSRSKFMTALKARSKSFGEPLAAIYEPRMYPRMLHALGLGYNCPTKAPSQFRREGGGGRRPNGSECEYSRRNEGSQRRTSEESSIDRHLDLISSSVQAPQNHNIRPITNKIKDLVLA